VKGDEVEAASGAFRLSLDGAQDRCC